MPIPINISASRGAAILGLSSWTTPVNVWLQIMESREPGFCRKRGYIFPEFEENAGLRWGKAFEDAIINLAESLPSGADICHREKLFTHNMIGEYYINPSKKSYEYITCHVDGIYTFHDSLTLHEGKTTSFFYYKDNFGEPGSDKVPIEYQIQCQHQMICTGAEKVILSVLVFPRRVEEWEDAISDTSDYWKPEYCEILKKWSIEAQHTGASATGIMHDSIDPIDWARTLAQMGYFHQYHINANKELQSLMIEHYREFWNNNVVKGIEPTPQSYDDIKLLCPEPVGTIVADSNIVSLAKEYKAIKKEIGGSGELAKRCDLIKVRILDYMRKAEATMDDESDKKFVLRDDTGKKLFQWDGRVFR